ncbi:MAG: aminopeptidase [Verrucomicrobiota bacterium]
MRPRSSKREGIWRAVWAAVALVWWGSVTGCQTAQYYSQAIRGQLQILTRREPTADLLASPAISAELKAKFELVNRLRAFAKEELGLPIDRHYLAYVDLGRRFAVWNVHAAPAATLRPKQWWYPLVGTLKYRGYFKEEQARRYAAELARHGHDVYVEGVEAYSTLGWFSDPLLNTFIHHSEPSLAEIVFHELAHQRLFIPGDTDLNEAFATVISEEGVRRWLKQNSPDAASQAYAVGLRRNRQFVSLVMDARQRLQDLYGDGQRDRFTPAYPTKSPPPWMKAEKERIVREMRGEYAALKEAWGGYAGYDGWVAQPLNNAQLNTISLYYELVPGLEALWAQQNGSFEQFYRAVRALQDVKKEARHALLRQLGAEAAQRSE